MVRKFTPIEWEPSNFSLNEVKAIEEAWQYAIASMSHFHAHEDISIDDLFNLSDDPMDDNEPLLVLSPVERLTTAEGFEDRNDIVQEAVRRDSRALVWASQRLRQNGYLWLTIVRRDATVVRYLSKKCRDDTIFCLEAVQTNPEVVKYISHHHFYNPRILRAAWQDRPMGYHSYTRGDEFKPLFDEASQGNCNGSLLRYAVVVFRLDIEQAREVAHDLGCLKDFDQLESDLEIISAVARHNPNRLADVLAESSHSIYTRSTMDKSPFKVMHKRLGSLPPLDTSGHGRRVRKLSETQ
mmetsp:Transcript_9575/g.18446  ORF Transcript_9575/g.18446 Transcript_9575/m.18446 type:complete len:296 (-) Transcript_9575:72-959(-)|eukprot:scaffold1992_cov187-Amphora_coffeaeformis.AAC.17